MRSLQTLLLVMWMCVPVMLKAVPSTDDSNDVVKKEVKERTCPACVNGNFTQNSWILSEAQQYRDEGFWRHNDCEVNPNMVECSGACITIMIQRSGIDNLFEYAGLLMGCSDDIKIGRDWPQNMGESDEHVNHGVMFAKIVRNFKVLFFFHQIQYTTGEIFDHVRMFGYPHNWPTGITSNTTTPSNQEELSLLTMDQLAACVLFSASLTLLLYTVNGMSKSKQRRLKQMRLCIVLNEYNGKQTGNLENHANNSQHMSKKMDNETETLPSSNDADKSLVGKIQNADLESGNVTDFTRKEMSERRSSPILIYGTLQEDYEDETHVSKM